MKILLVEDDDALRSGLLANLEAEGWEVLEAESIESARKQVSAVNLVVSDLRLPDGDGVEFVTECKKNNFELEIIIMTAFGSIPSAVTAMKSGARAYLTKPFDPEELILHIKEIEQKIELKRTAERAGRYGLVGISDAMKRVYSEIDAAASSNSPIMIAGATGTGKEETAIAIHKSSQRRSGPLIAVNLGALPKELIESELFGHERGAFTGAHAKKRGRFELSKEGTLFLDEIDSLPIELQPKLLRAIENSEIWPLGAEKPIKVDARIIAASNVKLEELVAREKFRKDLFYRLNVLRINMPSLKERPEDIPVIVRALLDRKKTKENIEKPIEIVPSVLTAMMLKEWNGNVRELANALERGIVRALAEDSGSTMLRLEPKHFDFMEQSHDENLPFQKAKSKAIEEWTRSVIKSALSETGGNVSVAARRLKIGRTSLLRLISKYKVRE